MKGQHSKLGKNQLPTRNKKREWNQVICSWKEGCWIICLPVHHQFKPTQGSPAQTPSPCPQLCIPVASLVPAQYVVSQSKELIQQKMNSAKSNI